MADYVPVPLHPEAMHVTFFTAPPAVLPSLVGFLDPLAVLPDGLDQHLF